MIRRLVKLVVALVVLVLLAGVALVFFIDSLAKSAVEHTGTKVLGVRTSLGSMRIGLVNPSASLAGLDVANPPGYADALFLALADGSFALDARSLMSEVIRIPSIRFSGLKVALDQKLDGSNAGTILANMKSALGSGGSGGPSSSSSGGRRFVVDELLIEDVVITARATGLPVVQPAATINVKTIRLESLGNGGKDPIGLDQLTAIVVNAVMKAAIEAGGSQMPQQLVEGVLGGLNGLGGSLPDIGLKLDTGEGLKPLTDLAGLARNAGVDLSGKAKAAGEEIKKGLDEGVEKVREGLGGLLK